MKQHKFIGLFIASLLLPLLLWACDPDEDDDNKDTTAPKATIMSTEAGDNHTSIVIQFNDVLPTKVTGSSASLNTVTEVFDKLTVEADAKSTDGTGGDDVSNSAVVTWGKKGGTTNSLHTKLTVTIAKDTFTKDKVIHADFKDVIADAAGNKVAPVNATITAAVKPKITSITVANKSSSGTANKAEAGDTIAIVFSEAMDKSTIGKVGGSAGSYTYTFDVHLDKDATGGKYLVEIKDADGADLIASFTTSVAAITTADAAFEDSTGTWSGNTLTITLIGTPSNLQTMTRPVYANAKIGGAPKDAVGNAATANTAATTANPVGGF